MNSFFDSLKYPLRMSRRILIILAFLLTGHSLYGQLNPGTIGNDQSICYGYSPAGLYFISAPSGGLLPYSYRWQRSNDLGNTWVDITGTTASRVTYSPPVLARSTMFRCRVTDATPTTHYSNAVTINVLPGLSAGTIGTEQTLNYDELPAPLTQIQAPSGGDGNYSFIWQSSANNLQWSNIEGSNSQGFAPQQMFTTTWFRRIVSDGTCGSVAGNTVQISVDPITLFTTETPSSQSDDARYNLGTEFSVLADGFITHARIYSHLNEQGLHLVRIYRQMDDLNYELLAGPFDWNFSSGFQGWRDFKLPYAVQVEGGRNYMICVTNGLDNNWYVQSSTSFNTIVSNPYIDYLNSYYGSVDEVPRGNYNNVSYFRDIVFIPFSPGSIGSSQTICYGIAPAPLTQTESPDGGSGIFNFQWQSSTDNSTWINIQGANSPTYAPGTLSQSMYFRRLVSSGGLDAASNPVFITVNPQFVSVTLDGTATVLKSTSTTFTLNISGGTPPYTVEYTCNNLLQPQILTTNQINQISTGQLVTGRYAINIVSVTDSRGCVPETIGDGITITAADPGFGTRSNNALLIVNSSSSYYQDFTKYVLPYIDWFGIPYEVCDVNSMLIPELTDYGVIVFGHRNVFSDNYPVNNIEDAVFAGSGLYSFDPHLFDFSSDFNVSGNTPSVTSHQIDIITSPEHYITRLHVNDAFNSTNDEIPLMVINNVPLTITLNQSDYTLAGGVTLATMSSGPASSPLLQVASHGAGRIVKWSSYEWMFDEPKVLGPVFGMDDLIWRSMVWSARKPFVMQGLPPMITMRVDDVDGTRSYYLDNLRWLEISNEYGFIPWCGTFIDNVGTGFFTKLSELVNAGRATAIPHALTYDNFIYCNQQNLPGFDPVANITYAWNTFAANSIPVSNYLVTHWYLFSADAVPAVSARGVEFIGTHIPTYDLVFPDGYPGNWINCGPYKTDRNGFAGRGDAPYFFAGDITWEIDNQQYNFFNVLTEIQDDGGYEWFPEFNVTEAINRGVRHLRRAINSMALPTLFTHEDRIWMTEPEWRQTMSGITSGLSAYYPEYNLQYTSIDDACTYIKAKEGIEITSVRAEPGVTNIFFSGDNDLGTKCYLFTEAEGQIGFELVDLPQVNASSGTSFVAVYE